MTIVEFIEARLAAEPDGCAGEGEYSLCAVVSESHEYMVAALRAVVALHEMESGHECVYPVGMCGWFGEDYPCPTLRHIAAIWSDHADYDEEWKP